MKNLIHLILLSLLVFGAKAQENKVSYKNEIGVNFLRVSGIGNFLKLGYGIDKPFNATYLNGFVFKSHFEKISFRIGYNYFQNKFSESGNEFDGKYYQNNGKLLFHEFRVGAEKNIHFNKFSFFFGLDLIVKHYQRKGVYENFKTYPDVNYKDNYVFNSNRGGFAPFAGLKYQISNQFSVSLETNLHYMFNVNFSKISEIDGAELYFNPINLLTVNYHFSKK